MTPLDALILLFQVETGCSEHLARIGERIDRILHLQARLVQLTETPVDLRDEHNEAETKTITELIKRELERAGRT